MSRFYLYLGFAVASIVLFAKGFTGRQFIAVTGLFARVIWRRFISALKEASSDSFDDNWTRIQGHDWYGYVRVWDIPDAASECARPNDPVSRERVCESAADLTLVLNSIPKSQNGPPLVYVVEVLEDHDSELLWNCGDGSINLEIRHITRRRARRIRDIEDIDEASSNYSHDDDTTSDSTHDNSTHGDDNHVVDIDDSVNNHGGRDLADEASASRCKIPPLSQYTTGLISLSSNRNWPSSHWCRLESFEIPLPAGIHKDISFAHVERNVLFLEHDEHCFVFIQCKTLVPNSSTVPDNLSKDERLERFMFNQLAEELSRDPFKATASFASQLYGLDHMYQVFKNTSKWKHMFILQYYHATLALYAEFVVAYEESYMNHKQPLFDPRRSEFKQGHLKEITKYSCRIRDIKRTGERMVEAIEYLVELAEEVVASQPSSAGPPTTSMATDKARFTELQLEIRGLCTEVRGCLSRLSTSLEHDIKFLGLRREMRQTNSVQRLTILATIFLPLSLSAGVLSMQTRFKDLGPLLYDFFGVVVLLGALVLPLLVFLSFLKIATDHVLVNLELRMTTAYRYKLERRLVSVLMWLSMTAFAIVVLVSFILGMFKDVILGAKILGYVSSCLGGSGNYREVWNVLGGKEMRANGEQTKRLLVRQVPLQIRQHR
uniref:Uncharacterized protein n=1 Tax=Colletotrichum fructicola (strain Nara gc5) TaxID=1213859 RepID=L2FK25_COLFN